MYRILHLYNCLERILRTCLDDWREILDVEVVFGGPRFFAHVVVR